MGFLGILEDKHLQHVPATVILSEEEHQITAATAELKHGTGKDADIILIPQPYDQLPQHQPLAKTDLDTAPRTPTTR